MYVSPRLVFIFTHPTVINFQCREDTAAYYRIKIRHLVNLIQGKLAYYTGLSNSSTEREAAMKWRQYCDSLVVLANRQWDDKEAQAKRLIRSKRTVDGIRAINGLMKSGALKLLVDDTNLRSVGDAAAHPGPITKDNVKGYENAVHAHVSAEGHWGVALNACITFLSH